jgi:hypothetical protein
MTSIEKGSPSAGSKHHSPSSSEKDNMVHHYKLDKTIGQGTYGKVKLGFDTRTGEKVSYIPAINHYNPEGSSKSFREGEYQERKASF